jgi:hypothetical protein
LAARTLAERYGGDKGAADWRHFGRLSGVTNRKAKYCGADGRYPFVRLIEASGAAYPERASFLQRLPELIPRKVPMVMSGTGSKRRGGNRLTIDDFRAKPEYGGDGNRIDLAYAVYALANGVADSEVRAAIASRDLSKKGPEDRQIEYIDRTLRKAASGLGR